ncbi:hypothetical protein ABK040_012950 [Willaertia magna]
MSEKASRSQSSKAVYCQRCGTLMELIFKEKTIIEKNNVIKEEVTTIQSDIVEENKLFRHVCPSCKFTTYHNPVPVVAAIVEWKDHEHIILIQNNNWPNHWYGLISGFIEHKEDPLDAIKREIKEELGIDKIDIHLPDDLIGVYNFAKMNELMIIYHVQVRDDCNVEDIKIDENEIREFKFIRIDKIRPYKAATGFALRDWLIKKGYTENVDNYIDPFNSKDSMLDDWSKENHERMLKQENSTNLITMPHHPIESTIRRMFDNDKTTTQESESTTFTTQSDPTNITNREYLDEDDEDYKEFTSIDLDRKQNIQHNNDIDNVNGNTPPSLLTMPNILQDSDIERIEEKLDDKEDNHSTSIVIEQPKEQVIKNNYFINQLGPYDNKHKYGHMYAPYEDWILIEKNNVLCDLFTTKLTFKRPKTGYIPTNPTTGLPITTDLELMNANELVYHRTFDEDQTSTNNNECVLEDIESEDERFRYYVTHSWSSRRNRKARRQKASRKCRKSFLGFHVIHPSQSRYEKGLHFLGFRFMNLSYWLAISFLIGSISMLIRGVSGMINNVWFNSNPRQALILTKWLIDFTFWIGTIFMLITGIFTYLESINTPNVVSLENWKLDVYRALTPANARNLNIRKLKFFGFRWNQIDFYSCIFFLLGTCSMLVSTTWQFGKNPNVLAKYIPLIVGSVLWLIHSYLNVLEVQHGKLRLKFKSLSWWIVWLQLFGNLCFLVGFICGFTSLMIVNNVDRVVTSVNLFDLWI